MLLPLLDQVGTALAPPEEADAAEPHAKCGWLRGASSAPNLRPVSV